MEIIDVQTGEVRAAKGDARLVSSAIGSCIAVAGYDRLARIGAIAHVMLPGRAPDSDDGAAKRDSLRYAENAVAELIDQMKNLGAHTENIRTCVAGGGNVLGRPDDTICQANIASVRDILSARAMAPVAQSVGGCKRRSLRLDVRSGNVYLAQGDSPEKLFLCYG
jgi:chemotaxis protein CheD